MKNGREDRLACTGNQEMEGQGFGELVEKKNKARQKEEKPPV